MLKFYTNNFTKVLFVDLVTKKPHMWNENGTRGKEKGGTETRVGSNLET